MLIAKFDVFSRTFFFVCIVYRLVCVALDQETQLQVSQYPLQRHTLVSSKRYLSESPLARHVINQNFHGFLKQKHVCPEPINPKARKGKTSINLSAKVKTWERSFHSQGRYEIFYADNFTQIYPKSLSNKIYLCMAILEQHLHIKFVKVDSSFNRNMVIFFRGNDCRASTGQYTSRKHSYVLLHETLCDYITPVMHELLHVLGMSHVHDRPDANQFITINKELSKFPLNPKNCSNPVEVSYDMASLLHYDVYSPSKFYGKELYQVKNKELKLLAQTKRMLPSSCDWTLLFNFYPTKEFIDNPQEPNPFQCIPGCLSTDVVPTENCYKFLKPETCRIFCYLNPGYLETQDFCTLSPEIQDQPSRLSPCMPFETAKKYIETNVTESEMEILLSEVAFIETKKNSITRNKKIFDKNEFEKLNAQFQLLLSNSSQCTLPDKHERWRKTVCHKFGSLSDNSRNACEECCKDSVSCFYTQYNKLPYLSMLQNIAGAQCNCSYKHVSGVLSNAHPTFFYIFYFCLFFLVFFT
jgi:hypothetical protein